MRLQDNKLLKVFTTDGHPVRAAVFAWAAGIRPLGRGALAAGLALCLAVGIMTVGLAVVDLTSGTALARNLDKADALLAVHSLPEQGAVTSTSPAPGKDTGAERFGGKRHERRANAGATDSVGGGPVAGAGTGVKTVPGISPQGAPEQDLGQGVGQGVGARSVSGGGAGATTSAPGKTVVATPGPELLPQKATAPITDKGAVTAKPVVGKDAVATKPVPGKSTAAQTAARPLPISSGLDLMRLGISNNMCALTFDDGPSAYTAQLLDTLAEYHIPATFFVVGKQVLRRPELIKRMLSEGHEVGNHSFSHITLRKQTPEAQQADLLKLDVLLRELGANPRFVRPPFGFYDHNTINVVQEMDGHIVMWTADSQDWRNSSDLDGILSNMQMLYTNAPLRGVFLFHDTHRLTVEHMGEILDALLGAGCRFVTLSEYIDSPLGDAPIQMLEVKNGAGAGDVAAVDAAGHGMGGEAAPVRTINFALEGRLDAQAASDAARGGVRSQDAGRDGVNQDAQRAVANKDTQRAVVTKAAQGGQGRGLQAEQARLPEAEQAQGQNPPHRTTQATPQTQTQAALPVQKQPLDPQDGVEAGENETGKNEAGQGAAAQAVDRVLAPEAHPLPGAGEAAGVSTAAPPDAPPGPVVPPAAPPVHKGPEAEPNTAPPAAQVLPPYPPLGAPPAGAGPV